MNICNVCGKELDVLDKFELTTSFGYGSKRDLDILDLKLCTACVDSLVDKLVSVSKVSPVIEYTGDINKPYGEHDYPPPFKVCGCN